MKKNRSFRSKKIRFVATLDLIKCRKRINQQGLLLTCAPSSDLPSNISTTGGMPANLLWHPVLCKRNYESRIEVIVMPFILFMVLTSRTIISIQEKEKVEFHREKIWSDPDPGCLRGKDPDLSFPLSIWQVLNNSKTKRSFFFKCHLPRSPVENHMYAHTIAKSLILKASFGLKKIFSIVTLLKLRCGKNKLVVFLVDKRRVAAMM